MMRIVACIPDPKRTMEGFRDTGYTLNSAVADIVDNSVNARANNIWVVFDKRPDNRLYARIIDDGYGMDHDGLFKAMKYGSPEAEREAKLSRFGLGLKTASTAMCKKLTVVTRRSRKDKIIAACWDLDLVVRENKWNLQIGKAEGELIEEFEEYNIDSGTMVCWDAIDRVGNREGERDVDITGITQSVLGRYRKNLQDHLELVYHRFIASGSLKMFLNGDEIEAWDPFVRSENTNVALKRKFHIQLPSSKKKYPVIMNAYVLPNKWEYSTEDARKRARIISKNQGFYVYRENRVIIAGDWLGMYLQEPHSSLLRIELSFPCELDEVFQLDVKKSSVNINLALQDFICREIETARRSADKRYRQGKNKGDKEKEAFHKQSQKLLDDKYKETTENVVVKQVNENQVEITNTDGTTIVTMPTVKTTNFKDLIEVVDSLDEGLFWEPALINNRLGVRFNKSHVYYERVYVPNSSNTVTICGIDSILWALAKCEQEVMSNEVKRKLIDLRYDLSRTLRQLATELPEVPDTED